MVRVEQREQTSPCLREHESGNTIASLALGVALGIALAVFQPPTISYLGDRAPGYTTQGADNAHVLTLNDSTTVRTSLIPIGMESGGAAAASTPGSDTRAKAWYLARSYSATNGSRPFLYESMVTSGKAHSAGDTLTLSCCSGSGRTNCPVLSTWSGLDGPSATDRKNGASGSGMAPSVATNGATQQASELLIATFDFLVAAEGFGMPAPMQFLSSACISPTCLFPGNHLLSSAASYSAIATTVNVTGWGAVLVTFRGDNAIFTEGFESGTIADWSFVVSSVSFDRP